MCPKWPQLRSPTIPNMYKKSQFRPPQLCQRLDGSVWPPKGMIGFLSLPRISWQWPKPSCPVVWVYWFAFTIHLTCDIVLKVSHPLPKLHHSSILSYPSRWQFWSKRVLSLFSFFFFCFRCFFALRLRLKLSIFDDPFPLFGTMLYDQKEQTNKQTKNTR